MSRSLKWLALLSTDLTLGDEEIVKLYKSRWDIEVFFKMAKSFLNHAKECQGRSFDALTAHAAVVCCRCIMLELARRMNKDPRTFGFLFHATCEELNQNGFAESLALLLTLFEKTLTAVMGISKELIRSLMDRFLNELPPIYRTQLLFSCQNNKIPS
ncbi:MAG: transposase [Syntrophaceae bacterium]|nr:transposase [Syntrophaceae bacterium]